MEPEVTHYDDLDDIIYNIYKNAKDDTYDLMTLISQERSSMIIGLPQIKEGITLISIPIEINDIKEMTEDHSFTIRNSVEIAEKLIEKLYSEDYEINKIAYGFQIEEQVIMYEAVSNEYEPESETSNASNMIH